MPESKGDQFVIIRIDGMHCHRCQQAIKRNLQFIPGVHEVEVDFPSAQASVLYDPTKVQVNELMDAIRDCGYSPTGFTRPADPAHS